MQSVSQAWKQNQDRTIVREGFVEVSLDVADNDALADASAQDNGAVYISNTPQVVSEVDRNIVPYSTLEQNLWVLDGSRKTIPTEGIGDCGFVGNVLSGDDCGFGRRAPIVTVNFTRVHSNPIPAVTITWGKVYNEFAKQFVVTAYSGETVVAMKEVTDNNSVTSVVEMDITEYDRIVITILRWCLPHRRARIEEIFVGLHLVYTKSELVSYSHNQTVDPLSTSLPKAEISFSVDNTNDMYDPYNESGIAQYFMESQEVKSRYGYRVGEGGIEWIKGGTFYLSEWKAPQNGIVADFTARDLFEFLFDEYNDNVTEIAPRNLYDLAEGIMLSANLPFTNDGQQRWHIDESLKNISTTAPLPRDTKANCLLMIANAGRCVMYQDRNGVVHIEPLVPVPTDYNVTRFNSYTRPEIVLSKKLKEVIVTLYEYRVNDEGEIVSDTTDVVLSVGDTGEQVKVDNPLVTDLDTANAICVWVANYAKNRKTLEMDWRADVRADALDLVSVENASGNASTLLTDISYKFNGSFKGSGTGRVM